MTKSCVIQDERDLLKRRFRHRDGLLRGGIGLTTSLRWGATIGTCGLFFWAVLTSLCHVGVSRLLLVLETDCVCGNSPPRIPW